MSNLSQERRALFQRARRDFEPTSNERERNARVLASRLGVTASALAGTLSTAQASAAGVSASAAVGKSGAYLALLSSKWLAVGLLVGAGAVSAAVAMQPGSDRAPFTRVVASAPRPLTRPQGLRPLGVRPVLEVKPLAQKTPASDAQLAPLRQAERPSNPDSKASSAPAGHSSSVIEEARVVRRAEEALREGLPSAALALLDELAREQPRGVLMEERSVERIDGLCQLGRTQQARAEVVRFLQTTPGSPLAKRVQQSCAAPLTAIP